MPQHRSADTVMERGRLGRAAVWLAPPSLAWFSASSALSRCVAATFGDICSPSPQNGAHIIREIGRELGTREMKEAEREGEERKDITESTISGQSLSSRLGPLSPPSVL